MRPAYGCVDGDYVDCGRILWICIIGSVLNNNTLVYHFTSSTKESDRNLIFVTEVSILSAWVMSHRVSKCG